jgi:hypothetical protein
MRSRGRKRSDLYAPHGTCPTCGWTGQDWGFNYHRSCTDCYNKWRKGNAAERRRRKPPNENVEIADGIVVTTNVRNRLKKQALQEVPRTSDEILWAAVGALTALAMVGIGCALFWSLMGHHQYTLLFGICGVASYIVFLISERTQTNEAGKRLSKVDARLEELAGERRRQIEEAKAFYASAEWRLVRKAVVEEQGPVCQKCHRRIRTDHDLTVDHIKPRSKFPELALERV